LSKIPPDSRIARSVKLVCDCFDKGEDWITARNKVVEDSADLGWFQAPGNIGFMVIGLLYGRGDFGRAICLAANCGDDTDCTAATAGSVMGILLGAEKIPEKWKKPIGDAILTKSFNRFNLPLMVPMTITELTERILRLQQRTAAAYPRPLPEKLDEQETARRLWQKSPYELQFDISFAKIGVEYLESPLVEPGKKCPIRIWLDPISSMPELRFRWLLPGSWRSSRTEFCIAGQIYCRSSAETELTPPDDLTEVMSYVTLEITADDRRFPTHIMVPLRLRNAVTHPRFQRDPESSRLMEMSQHKV
ncbi:MAG: ADP-ribosylglycohydrolase family protein, partial [Lentisphaeria bacterium]|nr:ADP-ribosylglycohydrolase family protein [Lentisphaeria bacterium]